MQLPPQTKKTSQQNPFAHHRRSVKVSDELTMSVGTTKSVYTSCQTSWQSSRHRLSARSSAIAEGPRDALSQLKSCQLLHNCTKNHI